MADSTNAAYVLADPQVTHPGLGSATAAASGPGVTPAVELEGIAQRLGHRWVLRGASLRVEPGEVVAVVGTNGSGKTTLLRLLATLLAPTRGSGRVFGRDLRAEADAVRRLTGMLGHATGLYDDLTAAENLRFASRMLGSANLSSTVDQVLDAVRMRDHADELVRNLSSGMRRRVALARVMLRGPRLLLLDEPYNSFDEGGVGLVDTLVRETARRGGAAIVATHDLGRRGATGFDRVVALSGGRVVESAPPGRRPT